MKEKTRFSDIGIPSFFTEKLFTKNIEEPTKIQKLAIPSIFNKENTVFRSATGTGKTFAYLLPLFTALFNTVSDVKEKKAEKKSPSILIIAPTLELCSQIKREADFLLQGLPDPYAKAGLLIGSANITRQIEQLKKEKPAVIAGNTARLLQLARMNKLRLEKLETLVLDEADKLISDNFLDEIKSLIELINPRRQVIACSATVSEKMRAQLKSLFGEIAFLETDEQEILREKIKHWAFFSEDRKKISCLCSFLDASHAKKVLIFTGLTGQVGNIAGQLQFHKISAEGLYSDMDKQKRKSVIENFKQGKLRALVSSDLASRGLDIPNIDYVIALDTPQDSDAYIHRAGRTARAGKQGVMVTIGNEEEMRRFSLMEKKLGITVYPKMLYQGRITAPDALP